MIGTSLKGSLAGDEVTVQSWCGMSSNPAPIEDPLSISPCEAERPIPSPVGAHREGMSKYEASLAMSFRALRFGMT